MKIILEIKINKGVMIRKHTISYLNTENSNIIYIIHTHMLPPNSYQNLTLFLLACPDGTV